MATRNRTLADRLFQGDVNDVIRSDGTGNPVWDSLTANDSHLVVTSQLAVGSNAYMNADTIRVGNSTTNLVMANNQLYIGNSSANVMANSTAFYENGNRLYGVVLASDFSSNATYHDFDITGYTDYTTLEIQLTNIAVSANNVGVKCRVSTDGGSTFDTTAGAYSFVYSYVWTGDDNYDPWQNDPNANSADAWPIINTTTNNINYKSWSKLTLINPHDQEYTAGWQSFGDLNVDRTKFDYGSGMVFYESQNDITDIRFFVQGSDGVEFDYKVIGYV